MIITNDYDKRQMDLIKKKLFLFKENSIIIQELVGSLWGLYRSMTYLDLNWGEKFYEELVNLESACASNGILEKRERS